MSVGTGKCLAFYTADAVGSHTRPCQLPWFIVAGGRDPAVGEMGAAGVLIPVVAAAAVLFPHFSEDRRWANPTNPPPAPILRDLDPAHLDDIPTIGRQPCDGKPACRDEDLVGSKDTRYQVQKPTNQQLDYELYGGFTLILMITIPSANDSIDWR